MVPRVRCRSAGPVSVRPAGRQSGAGSRLRQWLQHSAAASDLPHRHAQHQRPPAAGGVRVACGSCTQVYGTGCGSCGWSANAGPTSDQRRRWRDAHQHATNYRCLRWEPIAAKILQISLSLSLCPLDLVAADDYNLAHFTESSGVSKSNEDAWLAFLRIYVYIFSLSSIKAFKAKR